MVDRKAAIVTGGTRGIGLTIVRYLLDHGYRVMTCGRNQPKRPIVAGKGEAEFLAADVRDPEEAKALVEETVARFGRLDLVVNNAGGSPAAPAATASPRFSEAIIRLNLLAPLHVSQAAYPHLHAAKGSIVNIASVTSRRPAPETAAYGAAKAGLLSLTRSLAQEWGPEIRVNAVIAGLMETETTQQTYGSQRAQERIADSLPLKRLGNGLDIAKAVSFLASEEAAYISGAELAVDGGGERPLFLQIVAEERAKDTAGG